MTALGVLHAGCIVIGVDRIVAELWAAWRLWTAERRREGDR